MRSAPREPQALPSRRLSRPLLFVAMAALLFLVSRAGAQDRRYTLTTGQLYIPAAFQPEGNTFPLVFHLHGSATVAEQNLISSGKTAVLISVHLGSLSSPYTTYFSNSANFQAILDEARGKLAEAFPGTTPQWGNIMLTSFSAGYAGVREILKTPAYVSQIGAIVLGDSLYAGYVTGNQPNPAQLADFLSYAQEAAAGRKWFLFSHSKVLTYTYANTEECANYLIAGLGAARVAASGTNERGMTLESKCEMGRFAVYGYTGATADDHMDHFYALYLLMRQVDFGPPPPPPDFPYRDSFPSTGREISTWVNRFTEPVIQAFSPASPGGDGYVLVVRDPAGGTDSTRLGDATDADYIVQCDLYCEYRPELAADGFERVGIFARDQGAGAFVGTSSQAGACYALTWDSNNGRAQCLRVSGGALTDLAPAPVYRASTGWRRFRIEARGDRLAFLLDGEVLLRAQDAQFASGEFGIGFREYFTTNSNMRGTRADNFYAARLPLPGEVWMLY